MPKGSEGEAQNEGGPAGKGERDTLNIVMVVGHHHFQSICCLTGVLPLLKAALIARSSLSQA